MSDTESKTASPLLNFVNAIEILAAQNKRKFSVSYDVRSGNDSFGMSAAFDAVEDGHVPATSCVATHPEVSMSDRAMIRVMPSAELSPRAIWRGFSGPCEICDDHLLAFDLEDGGILQLTLSGDQVRLLAQVCGEGGANPHLRCRTHSSRSSGSPHSEGSTPDDGKNVDPPTKSSSAAAGE